MPVSLDTNVCGCHNWSSPVTNERQFCSCQALNLGSAPAGTAKVNLDAFRASPLPGCKCSAYLGHHATGEKFPHTSWIGEDTVKCWCLCQ